MWLARHAPNFALLAVWWAGGPAICSSWFRTSLADVALGGFLKTEVLSRLTRADALVVLARALVCALLVVKISLFERRDWSRPWLPIVAQALNIGFCWMETLFPYVRELYSLAHAPPEMSEELEAEALAEAARRRERQRRAAEAAAQKKAVAAVAAGPTTELAPPIPALLELALCALADALAAGCLGNDGAVAEELHACAPLPLPAHLAAPLFEHMRLHALIDDRTLPLILAPDAATLSLSPAAAGGAAAGCARTGAVCAVAQPEVCADADGSEDGERLPSPSARSQRLRHPPLHSRLSDLGLEMVAARCAHSLSALHLTDCAGVSDNGVRLLASGCTGLRVLELRRCACLTSACLLEVAQRLPRLEVLHVGGCANIDDAGVSAVATSCARLRSLDVSGLAVRDGSLHTLAASAHALVDLNISACLYLSSDAIRDFAHASAGLRRLTLSRSVSCSSWFTDSLLRELPKLELTIEMAQVPHSLRWHPLPFTEFY